MGVFLGEFHDLHVVSQFDCGLHGGVGSFTVELGLEDVLERAEFEPLLVGRVAVVDDVPVDFAFVVVAHHEGAIVDSEVHAGGDVLEVVGPVVPHPELVLIVLDVLLEVTLEGWELLEFRRVHLIVVLTAQDQVLASHLLSDMQTHLSIGLHALLDFLLGFRWHNWCLVAVEDLDLVLHVGMEGKWETSLEERLSKGATVSVERWTLDVSLGSGSELGQGNVETLDHVVCAESEYFWIPSSFLFGVGVDASIVLKASNPVGRDPVTTLAFGSRSSLVNVNLNAREVVVR